MSAPRPRIDWIRLPLPEGELERLNERSDFKGFLQTFGYLGLMVLTGWLCVSLWLQESWFWLIVAIYLHGTVMSFTINAVHELVHGTVFRTTWLNDAFAKFFGYLGWNNPLGFWASHQQHHLYTLHYPLDQEVVLPDRVGPKAFFRTFFYPRAVVDTVKHQFRSSKGFMGSAWLRDIVGEGEQRQDIHRFARNLLVFHGVVCFLSLITGWWIFILLISTHIAYGRSLQFLLNQTQHIGMRSGVNDFRLNCRTFETNPLFRLLYWQMNYHIEHHMYAGVPCYNLRKLHRMINKDLPETPKGLLATWYEIFYLVHKERKGPGTSRLEDTGKSKVIPEGQRGASTSTQSDGKVWKVWQCTVCAFLYDEALGWPKEGIAPGTRWEDVPEDWRCPDCGVSKSEFKMVEVSRPESSSRVEQVLRDSSLVVVGAGMATRALVREVRLRDPLRTITVISKDGAEPLNKPSLSTALRQKKGLEDLVRETSGEWARREGVNLLTGCEVFSIDREAQRVMLNGGEVSYGDLVLAVGASAWIPPIEGGAGDRVHTVNDLGAYACFRKELVPGQHVLIVGGGLIGCEMASDLIESGYVVTLLEAGKEILGGLIPEEVGMVCRESLQERGVQCRLETTLSCLEADDSGFLGKLNSGDELAVDQVLVAVGLRPNLELARKAGLETDKGIKVGLGMGTSDPRIHALGDCAQWGERPQPFVQPLLAGAGVLAGRLSGEEAVMDGGPWEIVTKIESFPLRVRPPSEEGTWTFEREGGGIIARCLNASGKMVGWVLGGREVQELNLEVSCEVTPVA